MAVDSLHTAASQHKCSPPFTLAHTRILRRLLWRAKNGKFLSMFYPVALFLPSYAALPNNSSLISPKTDESSLLSIKGITATTEK